MDNPTGFAGLSQNEFSNVGPRLATNVAETDYVLGGNFHGKPISHDLQFSNNKAEVIRQLLLVA